MKKIKFKKALIFFAVLSGIFTLTALTSNAQETVISNEIFINQSVFYLTKGQQAFIEAEVLPEETSDKSLIFTSENDEIATVDKDGMITAVDIGTVNITVSPADGGADSVNCIVHVGKSLLDENAQISLEGDTYKYTGSEITPKVNVYYDGEKLISGEDYLLNYSGNVFVGTASVRVFGIGDYAGEVELEFSIVQADIGTDAALLSGLEDIYYYTGKEIMPLIVLVNGTNQLRPGVDYTVSYANNLNVGTGEITIKGIDNYKGEKKFYFKISARNIASSEVEIGSIAKVTYNGRSHTPALSLKLYSYKPVLGKDYTVSYKNNVNIGKATVTIKGIGNFTGTRTQTFNIVPAANKLKSYGSSTKKTLKLYWNTKNDITGYRIYIYDSATKEYVGKKSIKKKETGSAKITGLKPGRTYYFKIAVYKTVGGVKYMSYMSDQTLPAMTVPAGGKIVQVCGEKKSTMIRWKKVTGASGYHIFKYNAKKKKYVKIAAVKGNSKFTYTDKGLKKNKTYKYKVRAFKKLNGKKLIGGKSPAKSVVTISFVWPVPGYSYISQSYNNKSSMYASNRHSGTDIASGAGQNIFGAKIVAAKGGIVDAVNTGCRHNYGKSVSCGCGGGFGNYVVVRTTVKIDGKKVTLRIIYGHMTKVNVKVGQYVSQKQMLGTVGSTGYSTGAHLHFEFRVQDSPTAKIVKRLNPMNYVKYK